MAIGSNSRIFPSAVPAELVHLSGSCNYSLWYQKVGFFKYQCSWHAFEAQTSAGCIYSIDFHTDLVLELHITDNILLSSASVCLQSFLHDR